MATGAEHSRLLLSPPPSLPRYRKHNKKHADPFFDLATKPLPSPSAPSSAADDPEEQQESLVTRIIISPILFTSFILSLFLVNRRDRARRTNSYPSSTSASSSSLLSYFSLSPGLWVDPEPYQDPASSVWERRGNTGTVEPHSVLSNGANRDKDSEDTRGKARKRTSWHLHKKIRKVTKLEISDAFEMRARVIVVLVAMISLVIVGVILGIRWVVRSMFYEGSRSGVIGER